METHPGSSLVKPPGVCGGKRRMAGPRIRVQAIVALPAQQGQSPDDLVSAYPPLSLAKGYAALASSHAHREDICRDLAEDETYGEEFKQQHSSRSRSPSDADTSRDALPPRCADPSGCRRWAGTPGCGVPRMRRIWRTPVPRGVDC
jgi:uncharacterized protein (DUF433 family)